jgi:SAM-dependent methyltransferase
VRLVDAVHTGYVHRRRVRVLGALLAETLPPDARVLDVGSGDGLLARAIADQRPDVNLRGVDVLVRKVTSIPVDEYDGRTLPFDAGSFDAVMFVDVLHHTDDPLALLREGVRASRRAVVIKDHLCGGRMDAVVLRFMDRVGNDRHCVPLPYNYWHPRQWDDAFRRLDLSVVSWRDCLGLYPAPASWLFDRSLHFVARVDKA